MCKFILTVQFISSLTFGQTNHDIVYTKEGTKIEGAIKSINDSYLTLDNENINLADLALGIKANGDVLTINSTDDQYRWIKNSGQNYHKIITLKKEIFAAEKVEIINNKIGFQDYFNGRYFLLEASEVALIIYKNGLHKMISDPIIANRCLAEIKDLNSFSSREPSTTIELTAEEQDYFARRALTKTRAFGEYLRILSDASMDELDQFDAVTEALKLFYDEERLVEVSSLNREELKFYKIGEYLNHIRALSYARVELLWNQVAYVNQIKKGDDGEYHGIITVEQIFKGYNSDNILVYQDVTQKNIDIVVKPLKQIIDGKEISKWDVFLSDIGVKSTSND
ncbi:hypothetical protein WJR50_12600 [Catalinimonas sp. 4WD22]|uniref:hypothetical protein n=1 Tax=Catalinimonas locisalis TaxID=3133978 RepID=UPI003100AF37